MLHLNERMNGLLCFMVGVLLFAVAVPIVYAGEQGHYVPGSWSPRDLISAPSGLTALASYVSFYDAQKARNGSGAKIDASKGVDVGADSWMVTPVLVYAPMYKPLGANWSATIVPAYGKAGANARLTAYGQNLTLFDNHNTDWGDLYVIPANLSWNLDPMWTVSAQYAFWAPVGEYKADRSDNVGLGYWSHNFRATTSFMPLGNPGLLLSASVLHEINGRKKGFDLKPAPHTSVELGTSMALSDRLMLGAMAGGIWETGDATGTQVAEDGRDRMLNMGVEASYWLNPNKLGVTVRGTQEFNVRDRFEGKTVILGLNYIF
jgi:hypothetical protein